jgi:hypothetical protein
MTGLPVGLSYLGIAALADRPTVTSTMRSEMVTVEDEGTFALAAFDTFLFKMNEEEEMMLDIIDPVDETSVYSKTLWEILDEAGENPAADDPEKFEPIRVVVEFLGMGEVRVTIPEWDRKEVDYGFFD